MFIISEWLTLFSRMKLCNKNLLIELMDWSLFMIFFIIIFIFILIFRPGTHYHTKNCCFDSSKLRKLIFSSPRMHLFNQKIIINNILFEFKITVFYFNIFQNVIYYFIIIYSSLQCHMTLQKSLYYADLLLKKISHYYQCWKQLCCLIFLWKLWYIFLRIYLKNRKFERTEFWKRNIL